VAGGRCRRGPGQPPRSANRRFRPCAAGRVPRHTPLRRYRSPPSAVSAARGREQGPETRSAACRRRVWTRERRSVALRPVLAVPRKLVGSRIFYRNATTTAIEKRAGQAGFEDRQRQFAHSPRTLSWKRTKTGSDAVTVSLPKVKSPCRLVNSCEQARPRTAEGGTVIYSRPRERYRGV
jgi:hypothetical protein